MNLNILIDKEVSILRKTILPILPIFSISALIVVLRSMQTWITNYRFPPLPEGLYRYYFEAFTSRVVTWYNNTK